MTVILPVIMILGLLAAPPLQVVGVVRSGMPPYEDGARIYRLEGAGCLTLRIGEQLTLQRSDERRPLGRLQVMAIKADHALARLVEAGETYPLKGDVAVRHEAAVALPALPPPPMPENPVNVAVKLPISAPLLSQPREGHREAIFFKKQSADLSPAAREKLEMWVQTWGLRGRWILGYPEGPGLSLLLQQNRVEQLKVVLLRLGVPKVEIRPQPLEPPGRYDSVFVCHETP